MALGDRAFRILGRVVTKDDINSLFPKFRILDDEPFTYETYYNIIELDGLDVSERLFEPTKPGLGIIREIMYVPTNLRTYLFSVPVTSELTWGSETVTFTAGVDFNGEIVY